MNEPKEEKEEKNYDYSQAQLGDIDKKLNDEIFHVKIRALATSRIQIDQKKSLMI